MPKESVTRGVLLIVLAFLCVAIMSAFAKAATGIATGTLVFFQNAIALLLFAPWALDHGFSSLKTKHILAAHPARPCRAPFAGAHVCGCKKKCR